MKLSMLFAVVLMLTLTTGVTCGLAQEEGRVFYVKATKGTELSGQIVAVNELQVKTGFGEVAIPVEKIEGIKMNADGQGSAVIAFTNGDLVTGKIEMSELQLKTIWGKAYIKSDSIDTVVASRFGRFYSDSRAGGWRFSRSSANQIPGIMPSGQSMNNIR